MTTLRCGICENVTYQKLYPMKRHILEQHSGFCLRCLECQRYFSRIPTGHPVCGKIRNPRTIYFQRNTGVKGDEARRAYDSYIKDTLPSFIIEERPPLFPPPPPLVSPLRDLYSDLAGLERGYNDMPVVEEYVPSGHKRAADTDSVYVPTQKRPRTSTPISDIPDSPMFPFRMYMWTLKRKRMFQWIQPCL